MGTVKITNRIRFNDVESDLVYPPLDEWRLVVKIDPEYVESQLEMKFGHKVKRINNKYAVDMGDRGIWYQHDGNTWLIERWVK